MTLGCEDKWIKKSKFVAFKKSVSFRFKKISEMVKINKDIL